MPAVLDREQLQQCERDADRAMSRARVKMLTGGSQKPFLTGRGASLRHTIKTRGYPTWTYRRNASDIQIRMSAIYNLPWRALSDALPLVLPRWLSASIRWRLNLEVVLVLLCHFFIRATSI